MRFYFAVSDAKFSNSPAAVEQFSRQLLEDAIHHRQAEPVTERRSDAIKLRAKLLAQRR